jgi:hypothetical protein
VKIYSVVMAFVAIVVVGCGGEGTCSDCVSIESLSGGVGASACPPDECEPSGEPAEYVSVSTDLVNTASGDRACHLSYSFVLANGTAAPGELYAFTLSAGGTKTYNFAAPGGSSVVFTARCWHPGYPDVAEDATKTIRTTRLFVPWSIHATYTGGATPSVTITNGAE